MPARVRLKLDPADKILLKRNLNKNGKGQRFFTHEIKRLSDPYVPMLTGRLKTDVTELPGSITYNSPYARKQWYENKGNGLRGARWTERMWIDRGKEIVQATAEYCGGKSK
ncbi:capsid protein [Blautia sp. An249]|uniref:minor capsid protein n=1 Tax=Blautia sp. An249 TaxID=1965603 RepID=UPI000B37C072|nr:minor capsid protein [Blautia sp. An249]OUO76924.1 capsid protein [Blautia sp. An249]